MSANGKRKRAHRSLPFARGDATRSEAVKGAVAGQQSSDTGLFQQAVLVVIPLRAKSVRNKRDARCIVNGVYGGTSTTCHSSLLQVQFVVPLSTEKIAGDWSSATLFCHSA